MMEEHRRRRVRRGEETGATLVEFALVAPVVFLMIFGIIGGCFLAYQNSALRDGATAGARMASIDMSPTNLVSNGTNVCETTGAGQTSITTAIAQASPLLHINPAPLCGPSSAGPLTQSPTVAGDVNITVTCSGTGGCSAPSDTEVTLQLSTQGLVAPFGLTFNMSSSSQDPVLGLQG